MEATHKIKIRKNERRKAQRLNIPLKIKYRWVAKRGILQEIFTQDISGGGIKIRTDRPFKIGNRLRTLLYFPDEPKPVNIVSQVAWCKKGKIRKKIYFDIGIKHIKIEPPDRERFILLFCEMMINFLASTKRYR